ncbi:hypothetical protein [Thermococcus sp.]|uniref:hypothetical protein n=1 Tax=Thermococcus sp. TaxID=35749 RepID=UPI0019A9C4D4|nr:hypothetical protein [Thermococcus sp.]MBC7094893.1 hypothetical protein [Thermococcus sp.]
MSDNEVTSNLHDLAFEIGELKGYLQANFKFLREIVDEMIQILDDLIQSNNSHTSVEGDKKTKNKGEKVIYKKKKTLNRDWEND